MKCRIGKSFWPGNIAIFVWVIIAGYALLCPAVTDADDSQKSITNIKIIDRPQTVDMMIQANRVLTYTSVKQPSPLALILYFSKTSLDAPENIFNPPNSVIHSASALELTQKGFTSKIKILLKKDAFYEITRENTGLKISFSKITEASPESVTAGTRYFEIDSSAAPAAAPALMTQSTENYSKANRLQSVYAAKFGDSLKVYVGADGMITNYKSFTIESPPRIIFEIFDITSPYKDEKIIPVNTKWVSTIRYHSYPDRVKVILETQKQYLNHFSGFPTENGLLIQMGQNIPSSQPDIQKAAIDEKPYPRSSSAGSATRLQSVYATQMGGSMLVTVRGNGPVSNYKTSVEQNPPRIIVDIFNIESPYVGKQSFPVDTQWVKSVSHERYKDRVQVVIDTRTPYLSAFSARPDRNGLVIHVGSGTGSIIADTGNIPPARTEIYVPPSAETPAVTSKDYTSPAWISKIDFMGKDAGKSTLVIETSREIQYDIQKTADKTLEVKLFNTRIPDDRNRPVAADRFESAVAQINPKASSMPDTAVFDIQLRESVPYFVEKEGNSLKVHFEASSMSPGTMASAVPPVKTQEPAVYPQPQTTAPPAISPQPQIIVPLPPEEPAPSIASAADASSKPGVDIQQTDDKEDVLSSIEDILEDDTPRYTGEKIALDFYETDIKNVFRILREISGKNFAVDKDVTGKVTLTLGQPVPWDQVLDLVLKMNKLGKTVEDNIIRIATRATLDEEEKIRQERRTAELTLRDQQKQLEPVITEYLPVNYSNAQKEIQPHIEKLLTKDRGSVSVDARTNMVIMTDTAEKIKRAKELIRKLDRVTPQVIIESRIVEASTDFSKAIGTQWDMGIGVSESISELSDNSDVSDMVSDKVGVGPQRGYDALGGTYGYNLGMNVPTGSSGSIGFNFTRIAGTPLLLNAKLMAMESNGEVKIVSAPKVVTLDNKTATIKQGLQYPYRAADKNGNPITTFKNIDLLLEVTPHVTPDNRISITINITKNDIGAVISGEQSFTTKEAETELLINDGDTVVIGGIIKTFENQGSLGMPGLAKIPILGWLFKNYEFKQTKEELLIFITPRIVQLEQRTAQF